MDLMLLSLSIKLFEFELDLSLISGGFSALIHKSLASYIKRLDTEIGNAVYLFLNGSGTLWDSQTGSNGLRLPSSNTVAIS